MLRCLPARTCLPALLPVLRRYKPAGGAAVPLCVTQYFPAGGQPGQYTRVTPSTPEPMSKANSADMAYAWSQGVRCREGGREEGREADMAYAWSQGVRCCDLHNC